MSKTKSIADLVTELQTENESLQSLKRLFNQACKNEFGYDVKALHDIIIKCERLEKKSAQQNQQGQRNQSERSEF